MCIRDRFYRGVKIIRSLLLPRGKGGGFRLFLNYFSFAIFASIRAFFGSLTKKYDAIIVHEPSPITQYYPAFLLNKLQRTPVYFWVMDLWPESLEIAGGIKNKYILNIFRSMVISFYSNSKKILITSKAVSYTHLDVYKRQHGYCCLLDALWQCNGFKRFCYSAIVKPNPKRRRYYHYRSQYVKVFQVIRRCSRFGFVSF